MFFTHPNGGWCDRLGAGIRCDRAPHPGCWAPTFPTNVAATISEPSATVSGSAANRLGTGPNTTFAFSRGLNSEWRQGHLRTFLSPASAFTHSETGHPA